MQSSFEMPLAADSLGLFAGSAAQPLHVLHVHAGNLYGGVESMLLTQVQQRALCPSMHQSFALCFAGRFSEELMAAGSAVHWLGKVRIREPFSIGRVRRRLRELLARAAFDVVVVHSTWSQAIFGPVVRAFKKPLVFWLHDVPDGLPLPERWARWTRPPDLVICNSKYTRDRLPKLYPQIQSTIIYCPVAAPPTVYSDDQLNKVRAEFDTPKDAVVILQISRLERHKGHLVHLEALALIKDLPNWVSWQVGSVQKPAEAKYFEQLKQTARRLGIADRVRFLGWQPEVHKLIAASDIYCQPNVYAEPFGITFIEALYAGKPVIGTSIGGPLEIVDDSCGILVRPGDSHSLAVALKRFIQEPSIRVKQGAAGPLRAKFLCDPSMQINRLYDSLSSFTPQAEALPTVARS